MGLKYTYYLINDTPDEIARRLMGSSPYPFRDCHHELEAEKEYIRKIGAACDGAFYAGNMEPIKHVMSEPKPAILVDRDNRRNEYIQYFVIGGKALPGTNWTFMTHSRYGCVDTMVLCNMLFAQLMGGAGYQSSISSGYNSVCGEGGIDQVFFHDPLNSISIGESENGLDGFAELTDKFESLTGVPVHTLYQHLSDWVEPMLWLDFEIEFMIQSD